MAQNSGFAQDLHDQKYCPFLKSVKFCIQVKNEKAYKRQKMEVKFLALHCGKNKIRRNFMKNHKTGKPPKNGFCKPKKPDSGKFSK